MSHPVAALYSATGFRRGSIHLSPADGMGVGPTGRTGRVRNRTKVGPEEKVKKPADGGRKKPPPARKTPPRGRYVDEYARPCG